MTHRTGKQEPSTSRTNGGVTFAKSGKRRYTPKCMICISCGILRLRAAPKTPVGRAKPALPTLSGRRTRFRLCLASAPASNRLKTDTTGGTYAVLIIGTSADEESFLRKLSAYSSPCGHRNGADYNVTSVLFRQTHSAAPEQRENLSLQVSPTPIFGRDPDKTDTAVSTIVTKWHWRKILFSYDTVVTTSPRSTEPQRFSRTICGQRAKFGCT